MSTVSMDDTFNEGSNGISREGVVIVTGMVLVVSGITISVIPIGVCIVQ